MASEDDKPVAKLLAAIRKSVRMFPPMSVMFRYLSHILFGSDAPTGIIGFFRPTFHADFKPHYRAGSIAQSGIIAQYCRFVILKNHLAAD